MISGTYVLTDSIDQAFDKIFTDIRKGSNAVISGKSAFDLSEGSGVTEPTFDESLLEEVRAVDGVAEAEGSVDSDTTQLIGDDGKAVVFGGAPNLGFSIADPDSRFNPLTLVEGEWPGPNEVVVDKETAGKEDFEVGETIGIQAEGPVQRLRISGIMQFSSGLSIGGATLAGFDLPTAQRLMRKEGRLDEIAVASKPGVTDAELVREIQPILPEGTKVQGVGEQVQSDAEETDEFITFLQSFLLAFGGIALFVGSFVIANSLSITIAQRTRELATLRMLGASRRQVLTSIILEALVVGVIASVIGLFLGLLLAKGLFSLFDAVGFTLPNTGLVFETRTVVVALLAGILVTLIASLRPAIRATRVPPVAAVREGATLPPGRFARLRGAGALLMIAAGFGALAYGLFGGGLDTTEILIWMGVGALLVFLGVALFSSRLVRPLAHVLGWPATRMGGAAGSLATGQRPAQPAANRVDRGRADDRPRARHARGDAGVRDRGVVQGRRQRPLHGRLRDHRAKQLLADPDRRSGRGGEGARRHGRRQRADRRGAQKRRCGFHHGCRSGYARRHRHGLEGRVSRRDLLARRRRRVRRRQLGGGQRRSAWARRSRSRSRTGRRRRSGSRGSSTRRPAGRRSRP